MNNPQKIYACKLKNEKLRLKSQSGGAFTAIAMCILRKGGIVYGCGMSSENQAIYKRVENIDDLEELKGSKYVQAKMGDIIKELKKDLDENKIVLFSGTPCYVSAVNIFMKNHKNIEKLYTVDLICHGVPSPMVYRDYLELCEKNEQNKIHKFFFREKISGGGWHQHMEKIEFENGTEVVTDEYTQLFYTNLALRPSCGKCHFSCMKRCADFTVGDYWGIQKFYPEFDDNTGVSLLFINSTRGLGIFEDFKDELELIEITADQACQQRNLIKPTDIPKVSRWFWYDYKRRGLKYCLKHWSPKAGIKFKIKRKILRIFNMWE